MPDSWKGTEMKDMGDYLEKTMEPLEQVFYEEFWKNAICDSGTCGYIALNGSSYSLLEKVVFENFPELANMVYISKPNGIKKSLLKANFEIIFMPAIRYYFSYAYKK